MGRVGTFVSNSGFVATSRELSVAGISSRELAAAVKAGEVIRVRRGWYATPEAPDVAVRSIRAGGSAGCVSGAALHGAWDVADARLHVAMLNKARTIKNPDSGADSTAASLGNRVLMHWNAPMPPEASRGVLPLDYCLAQVLNCQEADLAFAIVESALARSILDPGGFARLWRLVPQSKHHLLRAVRADAGSGNESLFRFRMLQCGIDMRSQVWIPGVGIVDFLIGDRLIVEIDSEEHHGGRAARLRDLGRDAAAAAMGGVTLRFDQSQIVNDWETVEATVLAVIARGDHLARRGSR